MMDGGENGITSKRIFEVEVSSPLKMLTSPLFKETFGAFLCSVSWGLGGFDDI
jgi:hypothetical protein